MTRHYATDDEIRLLVAAFRDHSLPEARWTHAAHFAVTLWLLRHHPEIDLKADLPDMIRGYNEATGGTNTDDTGYHETITQASLRMAADFLNHAAGADPICHILDALMAGPLGRSDWILRYWSRERLFSVQARRHWLDPDLQALPA